MNFRALETRKLIFKSFKNIETRSVLCCWHLDTRIEKWSLWKKTATIIHRTLLHKYSKTERYKTFLPYTCDELRTYCCNSWNFSNLMSFVFIQCGHLFLFLSVAPKRWRSTIFFLYLYDWFISWKPKMKKTICVNNTNTSLIPYWRDQ